MKKILAVWLLTTLAEVGSAVDCRQAGNLNPDCLCQTLLSKRGGSRPIFRRHSNSSDEFFVSQLVTFYDAAEHLLKESETELAKPEAERAQKDPRSWFQRALLSAWNPNPVDQQLTEGVEQAKRRIALTEQVAHLIEVTERLYTRAKKKSVPPLGRAAAMWLRDRMMAASQTAVEALSAPTLDAATFESLTAELDLIRQDLEATTKTHTDHEGRIVSQEILPLTFESPLVERMVRSATRLHVRLTQWHVESKIKRKLSKEIAKSLVLLAAVSKAQYSVVTTVFNKWDSHKQELPHSEGVTDHVLLALTAMALKYDLRIEAVLEAVQAIHSRDKFVKWPDLTVLTEIAFMQDKKPADVLQEVKRLQRQVTDLGVSKAKLSDMLVLHYASADVETLLRVQRLLDAAGYDAVSPYAVANIAAYTPAKEAEAVAVQFIHLKGLRELATLSEVEVAQVLQLARHFTLTTEQIRGLWVQASKVRGLPLDPARAMTVIAVALSRAYPDGGIPADNASLLADADLRSALRVPHLRLTDGIDYFAQALNESDAATIGVDAGDGSLQIAVQDQGVDFVWDADDGITFRLF